MYDIHFLVKYKSIEEELLQKIEDGEDEYDKEDVFFIAENLYRHEILTVLQINDITNSSIDSMIVELWPKMKENSSFLEIIDMYKDKYPSIFNDNNELCFIGMFCYNLFYLLHPCICQQLLTNKIDETVIEIFKKEIQQL